MRISLKDIARFSQCPRYYSFLQKVIEPPLEKKLAIAQTVINKAYLYAIQTSHLADWRKLIGWIDTLVFRGVDITDDSAIAARRITSEQILSFIRSWYYAIYVNETGNVFSNLSVEVPVGERHLIYSILPVVRASSPPSLLYIDDRISADVKMYNDINARGLAWLLSSVLESNEVSVQHLVMKEKGGFGLEEIEMDKASNLRTEEAILQIAESISCGIDYPSVTERCLNCAFKRKCRI